MPTTYSFKSVGTTREARVQETLATSELPFGIRTPLREGTEEIFAMTYSLADQVNDNVRNLILTNWGERLGQYHLGANLRPLLSEYVSQDDFDSAALTRIKNAVQRWMPYIALENYISEVDRQETSNTRAVIKLTITYGVPALNVARRALELKLYVM